MRRMFRRHIRKTLSQNVPPVLQEANFAFNKGEYGRAGELFENIAKTTDARGGRRAPIFHLQAGRARVLAGQVKLGMPSLKRGLELIAQRGEVHKLHRTATRLISDLQSRGLTNEAAEIVVLLDELLRVMPAMEAKTFVSKSPSLPTYCPSCGAGLRPDEVEWLDEVTAQCAYCGSPIRDGR